MRLRCAFALLPATILWGASFPLTLAVRRARDFSGHVARINAINTAGALAGAIAFTLIGIPHARQPRRATGAGRVRRDQRHRVAVARRRAARAVRLAVTAAACGRGDAGSCRRCRAT